MGRKGTNNLINKKVTIRLNKTSMQRNIRNKYTQQVMMKVKDSTMKQTMYKDMRVMKKQEDLTDIIHLYSIMKQNKCNHNVIKKQETVKANMVLTSTMKTNKYREKQLTINSKSTTHRIQFRNYFSVQYRCLLAVAKVFH